jgi:hypothetical protein
MTPLFEVGEIIMTPGAAAALKTNGKSPGGFLFRHECGDWGDVPPKIATANQSGLECGHRIISSFRMDDGRAIWVITRSDRALTEVLLPSESVVAPGARVRRPVSPVRPRQPMPAR